MELLDGHNQLMEELDGQRGTSLDKPNYINALERIYDAVREYVEEHGLSENHRSPRTSSTT
jgi:hypothetical protein